MKRPGTPLGNFFLCHQSCRNGRGEQVLGSREARRSDFLHKTGEFIRLNEPWVVWLQFCFFRIFSCNIEKRLYSTCNFIEIEKNKHQLDIGFERGDFLPHHCSDRYLSRGQPALISFVLMLFHRSTFTFCVKTYDQIEMLSTYVSCLTVSQRFALDPWFSGCKCHKLRSRVIFDWLTTQKA